VPQLRLQDPTNKQSSLIPDPNDLLLEGELVQFESEIGDLFDQAEDLYQRLLDAGVAKESARKVLPLNTPTRLYMSGTIRSWIHYLQIRTGPETQLEHREVAQAVSKIFAEHLPTIHESLLCPKSTSPSTRPEGSLPSSQPEPTIGSRLSGSFGRLVSRLSQFRESISRG
jgi:thymidylate synthase (FAD)